LLFPFYKYVPFTFFSTIKFKAADFSAAFIILFFSSFAYSVQGTTATTIVTIGIQAVLTRIIQITAIRRSRCITVYTTKRYASKTSVCGAATTLRHTVISRVYIAATRMATTVASALTALIYPNIAATVTANRLPSTAKSIVAVIIAASRLTEVKTRSIVIAHIGISFLLVYLR
jgi:hypothetical protein